MLPCRSPSSNQFDKTANCSAFLKDFANRVDDPQFSTLQPDANLTAFLPGSPGVGFEVAMDSVFYICFIFIRFINITHIFLCDQLRGFLNATVTAHFEFDKANVTFDGAFQWRGLNESALVRILSFLFLSDFKSYIT